ncbi:NAD(P)/FAD-dependent oxidoreductase [Parvibaculum sp.]|uniref:FAD-dependent oxidoreductase n=1 Tax=Parvibaculum sp. TaxID=2024848 RepID=UPI0025D73624|nr:NAD(P)/FAD-dependent oxidoreductase [Parvibaculum sp.]
MSSDPHTDEEGLPQKDSFADAIAPTLSRARLRILIVGAGIAGVTLAALLKQRGEAPVLIEKNPAGTPGGYMLGLLPLGGRVLHGLGLHDAYLAESRPMNAYEFNGMSGKRLRHYSLTPIMERYGAYQGIERGALLDLLHGSLGDLPVHYGTTIRDLAQDEGGVDVTFDDGSHHRFDLVVAADGIHSTTRDFILSADEYTPYRTGWGGWVMWTDAPSAMGGTYRELWGPGWGMGLYPVKDRTGIFLAGRIDALKEKSARSLVDKLKTQLGKRKGPFADALESLEPEDEPFFWDLDDGRAKRWSKGRVVLLGDAAAAFLPTAGAGASVAMDSAAALADELSRTDAAGMTRALTLYEKRQRSRVETAQDGSRSLARLMFVNSPALVRLRNASMYLYTQKRLLKSLDRMIEGE